MRTISRVTVTGRRSSGELFMYERSSSILSNSSRSKRDFQRRISLSASPEGARLCEPQHLEGRRTHIAPIHPWLNTLPHPTWGGRWRWAAFWPRKGGCTPVVLVAL